MNGSEQWYFNLEKQITVFICEEIKRTPGSQSLKEFR
jgi:hypothetical protein